MAPITLKRGQFSAFITEGEILDGYLDVSGVELRFKYRPTGFGENQNYYRSLDKLNADQQHKKSAEFMASRLDSWDVTDRAGNAIEITADNLLRLAPPVFLRLYAVVTGMAGPDDDPREAVDQDETATTKTISE